MESVSIRSSSEIMHKHGKQKKGPPIRHRHSFGAHGRWSRARELVSDGRTRAAVKLQTPPGEATRAEPSRKRGRLEPRCARPARRGQNPPEEPARSVLTATCQFCPEHQKPSPMCDPTFLCARRARRVKPRQMSGGGRRCPASSGGREGDALARATSTWPTR
jgi:hypothetical protein